MSTSPRPEAIRGAWYRIDPDEGEARDGQLPGSLMVFDVDGSFRRYDLEDGDGTPADDGGYTFDGDFLIVRGGRTRTYRVQSETPWKWRLEGKKETWDLLRGLYRGAQPRRLPSDRREELERMPQRVLCRRDIEDAGVPSPMSLVDPSEDEGDVTIGSLFASAVEADHLWVAVTPFVDGLGVEFWQRLVRGSFLPDHLGEAAETDTVDVRVVGQDAERTLSI